MFAIPGQLVAGTFLVLFAATLLTHVFKNAFVVSLWWGLVLIASFSGFGTLLTKACLGAGRVSFGLRAVWGMAFVIAVGGALCLVGIASRPLLLLMVGAGLVVWQVEAWRSSRSGKARALRTIAELKRSIAIWPAIAAALGIAAWDTMGWTGFDDLSPRDDFPAYFPMAREIVDRGTFIQPFSFRRLCVLGGQELLHALHLASGAPSKHMHMMDGGVCVVMLVLLIAGQLRDVKRLDKALLVCALAIAATLPFTRINVGTEVSTAVLMAGVYCTWESSAFRQSTRMSKLWIVALILAANCTLRNSNLVASIAILGYMYVLPALPRLSRAGVSPKTRQALRELGFVSAAFVASLLPWLLLSHHSSGSFLYPLQSGYFRKDWGLGREGPTTLADMFDGLWVQVTSAPNGRSWPLLAIAVLSLGDRPRYRSIVALLVATAATVLAIGVASPDLYAKDAGRYAFGFCYALAIGSCLAMASGIASFSGAAARLAPATALVAVAVGMHLTSIWDDFTHWHTRFMPLIASRFREIEPFRPRDADALASYRDLQDHVPAKERILTMVDEPYRFDYRRNPILIYDLPGATAPGPGVPFFQGPEAVVQYLRGTGIRFVAVIRPTASTAIYRREEWENGVRQKTYFLRSGLHVLDAIDSFEKLAASKRNVYEAGGLYLLDLDAPAN
jgi:hypothetical protein